MTNVILTRQPQFLPCLLITIHGTEKDALCCSIRGDQAEAIRILEKVLLVLKYAPELEIE
jgi:hypothetical protein